MLAVVPTLGLAGAGIGVRITPMAGMLSHLVQSNSQRQVMLLHADNSAGTFALRGQFQTDLAQLPGALMLTWFVEPSEPSLVVEDELVGFMDVSTMDLPVGAEYYLCGPLVFMQAVRSALIARGMPAQAIQYEVFVPDLWLADFQKRDKPTAHGGPHNTARLVGTNRSTTILRITEVLPLRMIKALLQTQEHFGNHHRPPPTTPESHAGGWKEPVLQERPEPGTALEVVLRSSPPCWEAGRLRLLRVLIIRVAAAPCSRAR